MNKRKFLIVSILTVFLCGILLASVGAAHAKTVTIHPKFDKDKTKHVGKYKIVVGKYKTYYDYDVYDQQITAYVYYKGEMLNLNEYKVKVYYKYKGKQENSKWKHGQRGVATYYKMYFPPNVKITKVKVKFHHKVKKYFKYYQLYRNGKSLGEYCRSKTKIDRATIRETQRQKGGRITQKAVYGYK